MCFFHIGPVRFPVAGNAAKTLAWGSILAWLAGFSPAHGRVARLEVQVMPPWNIYKTGGQVSTFLSHPDDALPMGRVRDLDPHFLASIITGLQSRGIAAYPALYTSGV